MDINLAGKIMGKNFIGPEQLNKIARRLNIFKLHENKTPPVPFSESLLRANKNSHLLVFGVARHKNGRPLTINTLRKIFGADPSRGEPCFYNQDWYETQAFANKANPDFEWHLLRKNIIDESRGQNPESMIKELPKTEILPSAIAVTFSFFTFYLLRGEILWKNDFVWCSDLDDNGDRIYVGRYADASGKNKKGFNIHRHLKIRSCYGIATQIEH
jgi:hypothetical protein